MSDLDKELKIKITTAADRTGAQQAASDLKNLGNETGKTSEKMQGMRMVASLLGRETIPELGHAFHALEIGGPAAIFIGLLSVIGLITEALKEQNKQLDDAAEKAKDPVFKDAMDARREAIEKGVLAQEAMADKTAYLIDAEKTYQDAVRESIEINKDLAAAAQKREDAGHGFDTDLLKRQLDEGLITQAQYYQKLTALEVKYEQDKLRRERDAHQQEIRALSDELSHVMQRRDNEGGAPQAALAAETAARAREQTDRDNLADFENGEKAAAQKRFDVIDQKISKNGSIESYRKMVEAGDLTGLFKEDVDEYDKAKAAVDVTLNKRQVIRDRLPGEASASAAAERNSKYTEDQRNKLIEDEHRLNQEIANLRAKYGISEGVSQSAATDATRKIMLDSPFGKQFAPKFTAEADTAKGIADRFEGGKQTSVDEQSFMLSFANALGAKAQSVKQAADYLEKNMTDTDDVMKVIAHIIELNDKHATATYEQKTALSALEAKVDKLKSDRAKLPPTSSTPPPNGI